MTIVPGTSAMMTMVRGTMMTMVTTTMMGMVQGTSSASRDSGTSVVGSLKPAGRSLDTKASDIAELRCGRTFHLIIMPYFLKKIIMPYFLKKIELGTSRSYPGQSVGNTFRFSLLHYVSELSQSVHVLFRTRFLQSIPGLRIFYSLVCLFSKLELVFWTDPGTTQKLKLLREKL